MLSALRKLWSGLSASFWQASPESLTLHLKPEDSRNRLTPKFDTILVVEDIPQYAQASLEVIGQFYKDAELTVHICHTFAAALKTFQQCDIKLVILDLDLDDLDGDGALLLKNYRLEKPDIIVLANSSESRYNEILLKGGAIASVGKNAKNLHKWLTDNG